MLTFELIKNCAGVVLISDCLSLRQMHRVVHDVNDRSAIIRDKEGFFVSLAYDLRKAYEGQRRKMQPHPREPESGPRFGVEILWPVLLVQSRQLRESLAFIDHTKEHQAVAWELEYMIEQALQAEFQSEAAEVRTEWERLSAAHPFMEENATTRTAQFAAWKKVERRKGLAGLLSSLDPMYPSLYSLWTRNGVNREKHFVALRILRIGRNANSLILDFNADLTESGTKSLPWRQWICFGSHRAASTDKLVAFLLI